RATTSSRRAAGSSSASSAPSGCAWPRSWRRCSVRELLWRLGALLRRRRLTAEKREELELHHDLEVEAGLRLGLSPEEAGRPARHRAGLVSEGMESTREALGFRWLDGLLLDLRHAFRALTRNRRFGTMAVVVLAASVAIDTLIFSMLEGVVLRPL